MIDNQLSNKILTIGVSKNTYGGMTSVLVSYENIFAKMRFIPSWRLGNKAIKAWYAFQAIVRCIFLLLFDKQIKILHIHGAANASFYRKEKFIRIGKVFNKKIIFHQHAADFEKFFEATEKKTHIVETINMCDKLIVLSQSWKNYFSSIGVHQDKICILNNIVTPPKEWKLRIPDNKLHLLYLGEISYRKGIFDLLNTINDNKQYFTDKILLRIGGNSVDGDIDIFISENNLNSLVSYEGWVSGIKKTECLEWADLYILPSYNEGLPIAILEAMSYHHPVISTNVGGIPEILRSHKNGILIEAGNIPQMKDSISFFIENPNKIDEYGENAYSTVTSFFPENVYVQLESIYKELI